jgi:hypothetical protein
MPIWVWQIVIGVLLTAGVAFHGWVATSIIQLREDVKGAKTELSMIPLSAMIQSQLLNSLHHDHPKYAEADALIDKFKMVTITTEELQKLKLLLGQRALDADISELERKQSVALLAIMDVVVIENESSKKKAMNALLSIMVGVSIASIHTLKYLR